MNVPSCLNDPSFDLEITINHPWDHQLGCKTAYYVLKLFFSRLFLVCWLGRAQKVSLLGS